MCIGKQNRKKIKPEKKDNEEKMLLRNPSQRRRLTKFHSGDYIKSYLNNTSGDIVAADATTGKRQIRITSYLGVEENVE